MTLADLIEAQQGALTDRWLQAVRPLAPRQDLDRAQLVDSLPAFLAELVRALRQLEDAALGSALPGSSPVAEAHGAQRHRLGFATSAVAREYPLLHEAILAVAQEAGLQVQGRESILLARCMGTAAAEALAHFASAQAQGLREDSASARARQVLAEQELGRSQEARARARESETQLRLVLDTVPHAINFVDAQERYVLTNDTYREWFGLEPEAVRGRTVREVVGEENYRTLEPFVKRALAGEASEYERPFVFRDGRRGYVHGHAVPHRAPDGRVLGYVAIVQDITERHRLLSDLSAARAELEQQRARLLGLFENAPAIVCTLRGPEHVFEMANPLYQRVVGGGRPLVGLPVREALPEVVAQGFISLLDRVYRTGEPYVGREVPLRLDRRGDGTLEDTCWTFVYQPLRDEGGTVVGIAAFGFEVTEHVQARQQALALAAQLEAIFDSFPEPLYVGDERGIQRANRPAVELLGYRTLEEVSQGIALLSEQMLIRRADTGAPLPPEDNPFNQALRGRTTSVDLLMRHQQTGEDRVVRNVCAPVRVGGEVVAAVGINHDITDRQHAEAARRVSEERLRLVVDAIPALVAFLDPQHRYIFGNAAYGRWFGVDAATLPGRPIAEVIGEESYRRVRPYIERALAGEYVRYESPFVFGGGREGVLQAAYMPQRTADGRVTGYVAIGWDVSAERSAEQELRQRAELERQLIGIVSHDLRNPLQAIQLSAATLLRRAGQDERQSAALLRIVNTTERMTRMIRDLLDFTRARLGGGLAIERRPLDLHALARQVVDEVLLANPARQVEVVAQGDAHGTWDGDRLAQLLGNLLTNALAYSTPHSPVQVTTRGLEQDVLLEVHNRGEPIPPEQLQRLFRPFERGENLSASAGRSIGLGLYIVDAIVRAHGGRIEVRSTEEEGTTFTARLPRG